MVQALSKTLKVTLSGSYQTSNRDIESFDNVVGVIPRLDEDKATQMAIRRYARVWIMQAKKPDLTSRYGSVQRVRQVFVDSIEDTFLPVLDKDGNPTGEYTDKPDMRPLSYVGKNVMEMNFGELQDFASSQDLADVPLYRAGSLTHARRVAFSAYAIKVLDLFEEATPAEALKHGAKSQNLYDHRVVGFHPAKFEPIIADGSIRRQKPGDNIEESIDRELLVAAGTTQVKSGGRLTLAQLQAIAEQKKIPFNKGISFDALYKKIYATKAA